MPPPKDFNPPIASTKTVPTLLSSHSEADEKGRGDAKQRIDFKERDDAGTERNDAKELIDAAGLAAAASNGGTNRVCSSIGFLHECIFVCSDCVRD